MHLLSEALVDTEAAIEEVTSLKCATMFEASTAVSITAEEATKKAEAARRGCGL